MQTGGGQEPRLANIAWPSHPVLSFTGADPWCVLTYDTRIFTPCVHSNKPICLPLPQTSLSLNFNLVPSRLLTNKPCCSPFPISLHMSLPQTTSLSTESGWPDALPEALCIGRISPHYCLLGSPEWVCNSATVSIFCLYQHLWTKRGLLIPPSPGLWEPLIGP